MLVRYADDLVALCHSREQAMQVKAALAEWLTPRGLTFNEDKTTVVSVEGGLDFLGFNVWRCDSKLLIKPSKAAVKRIRRRLRAEMRALRGANVAAVLRKINPIVRGWSAYYRTVVSSQTFSRLDDYLWKLTYKWARQRHSNKSAKWVINRYFGMFNKPGRTRGCSATAAAAPTCASSPGPPSSATRSSRAPRHPTIPTSATTGPDGAARDRPHRWTGPTRACYRHSTAAAPCAVGFSCTPTTSPKPHASGNNGSPLPARR